MVLRFPDCAGIQVSVGNGLCLRQGSLFGGTYPPAPEPHGTHPYAWATSTQWRTPPRVSHLPPRMRPWNGRWSQGRCACQSSNPVSPATYPEGVGPLCKHPVPQGRMHFTLRYIHICAGKNIWQTRHHGPYLNRSVHLLSLQELEGFLRLFSRAGCSTKKIFSVMTGGLI